jgi:cytochrome c oxidase assembly protein subunit 15
MSRLATNTMMGVALVQVSLGIATLVYFVPVPIAAAHQSGSLTLLTVAIWLLHTLRHIK